MRRRLPLLAAVLVTAVAPLTVARGADPATDPVGPAGDDCTAAGYFTRTPTSGTEAPVAAPKLGRQMLRFVNLSDSHIIDDEASAAITGNVLDPALDATIANTSAQRLQEEFTDEVLDAMEGRIVACQQQAATASSFMIATGDLTDNMTLNELRRYIDNLDGAYRAATAFEHYCGYAGGAGLSGVPSPAAPRPACATDAENAMLAGRTVDDAQAPAPDPEDPTYLFAPTRTARQLGESTAGSLAAGTYTAAPGLPTAMRDTQYRLPMPHYAVFGNHDGAVRGTVAYQDGFQAGARAFGRYFTGNQREFINEFFFTSGAPAGHGFNFAGARLADDDPRNDGWYSFVQGGARLVVLNTIIDGVTEGSSFRDPSALEKGGMSAAQLEWLDAELAGADAAGQPALVFSHHPTRSFHDAANGAELDRILSSHDSLVAHIAGHTHENRVRPHTSGANHFWQVETASLVDWPQEGRIVELYRLRKGAGYALRLTMIAPLRSTDGARASYHLSQAEAECTTRAIVDDPAPSDGGEAAVRDLFCRADRTLAEGAPYERDVILLP